MNSNYTIDNKITLEMIEKVKDCIHFKLGKRIRCIDILKRRLQRESQKSISRDYKISQCRIGQLEALGVEIVKLEYYKLVYEN